MPITLYHANGAQVQLTEQEIENALRTGNWWNLPDAKVNVKTPDGLVSVPFTRENVISVLQNKDELESSDQAKQRLWDQKLEQESSLLTAPLEATRSFVKGGLFGLDPVGKVIDAVAGEGYSEALERKHDTISTMGEIAGAVAPALATGGTSLGARALAVAPTGLMERGAASMAARLGLATGKKITSEAAVRALEGAASSLAYQFGENVMQDKELLAEMSLANVGMGAILGGGGALVGIGIPKAIKGTGDLLSGAKSKFHKNYPKYSEMITGRPADQVEIYNEHFKDIQHLISNKSVLQEKQVADLVEAEQSMLGAIGKLDHEFNSNGKRQVIEKIRAGKSVDVTEASMDHLVSAERQIALSVGPEALGPGVNNYMSTHLKDSLKAMRIRLDKSASAWGRELSDHGFDVSKIPGKARREISADALESVWDTLGDVNDEIYMLSKSANKPNAEETIAILSNIRNQLQGFVGDKTLFGDMADKINELNSIRSKYYTLRDKDQSLKKIHDLVDGSKYDDTRKVKTEALQSFVKKTTTEADKAEVVAYRELLDTRDDLARAYQRLFGDLRTSDGKTYGSIADEQLDLKGHSARARRVLDKAADDNDWRQLATDIEGVKHADIVKDAGSFSMFWGLASLVGLGQVAPLAATAGVAIYKSLENPFTYNSYKQFFERVMNSSKTFSSKITGVANLLKSGADAAVKGVEKTGEAIKKISPLLDTKDDVHQEIRGLSLRTDGIFGEKFGTLNEVDPGLGSAVKSKLRTIFTELEKAAPEPKNDLLGSKNVYQTPYQQNVFMHKVNLAVDPSHIFTLIKSGQINSEYMRFFSKVYPLHYQQLIDGVMSEIDKYKNTSRNRILLSKILGYPVSNSLSTVAQNQELLKQQRQQQAPVPKTKLNINTKAFSTDMQLLENKGSI